jgi:outer membrane protein OmpA-like peptidoglycan-associated protein
MAADGQSGYLTSNRAGGKGGDDLYFFEYSGYLMQVDIFDLKSGAPLPGASLYSSRLEDTLLADSEGRAILRFPGCSQLTATQTDYDHKVLDLCPEELHHAGDTVFIAMGLAPASDKYLEGVVFDQSLGRPVAEVEILLQGTSCEQQLRAFSDKDGRFKLQLSHGCCYELQARHSDYQPYRQREQVCPPAEQKVQYTNVFLQPVRYYGDAARPTAQGSPQRSDTDIFDGFDPAPGTSLYDGKPAFRLNVYYDVGRSSVQAGSVPELFRLRDLLLRNPGIQLEIHSHTDATGSRAHNRRISQKRADQIVRYLVGEGIDRQRLSPIGHGESQLLNDCTDGVPCPEWQHQENRRTEFVVLRK